MTASWPVWTPPGSPGGLEERLLRGRSPQRFWPHLLRGLWQRDRPGLGSRGARCAVRAARGGAAGGAELVWGGREGSGGGGGTGRGCRCFVTASARPHNKSSPQRDRLLVCGCPVGGGWCPVPRPDEPAAPRGCWGGAQSAPGTRRDPLRPPRGARPRLTKWPRGRAVARQRARGAGQGRPPAARGRCRPIRPRGGAGPASSPPPPWR